MEPTFIPPAFKKVEMRLLLCIECGNNECNHLAHLQDKMKILYGKKLYQDILYFSFNPNLMLM